ncbi:uncharacterized protein RCC_08090 [Ramularia collo-cygni]|uniref:Rhodopsin domain-containing protein n=1 Tax=Ramularia collo-cygni TaxID=112498 RepID=A0A2D3UZ74_9PEZI|nr:uncharacterized protein RCC_08090 [Ramularia collo-cygni]CZT22221.1 uncharacterized protein RCC_08090 [Ramularia collo-cygni]
MPVLFERQNATLGLPPPDPAYCAKSNLHEIMGVVIAMHIAATVVMFLRTIVRVFMTKSFGSDDYAMLAAWMSQLATFICWIGERPYANGKRSACITPHDYEMHARWQYCHSLFVIIGLVLVKVSIALFLMRLVPPGKKWKHFLWASIVFLFCFLLACLGTLIWQCVPVQAAWDFSLRAEPGTTCWSNDTFAAIGLFNSAINCVTDFMFAMLPIPIIVKLQINVRTKVTLAVILSFGYFACAAGTLKAVKQYTFFKQKDPFWHNSFNVWAAIELSVGIIAGSLPSLKPMFASLLSTTKSLVAHYSPHNSHNRTADRSGFRRHDDDSNQHDVKLENWTEGSKNDSVIDERPAVRSNTRVSRDHNAPLQDAERAYSVRVRSGTNDHQIPKEDDEWETIDVTMNESSERLHRPLEIHKEVEIFSTSQRRKGG